VVRQLVTQRARRKQSDTTTRVFARNLRCVHPLRVAKPAGGHLGLKAGVARNVNFFVSTGCCTSSLELTLSIADCRCKTRLRTKLRLSHAVHAEARRTPPSRGEYALALHPVTRRA